MQREKDILTVEGSENRRKRKDALKRLCNSTHRLTNAFKNIGMSAKEAAENWYKAMSLLRRIK